MSSAAARPTAYISARDGKLPAMAAGANSAACDALTTRTLIAVCSGKALGGGRGVPGVVAVERVPEVEDVREILSRVGRLAQQQAEVDEREDDVSELRGRGDAPVLEHHPREHSVTLQRQAAARLGQFAARDVTALGEARLAELERGQHEQIRVLVETRLAQPDAVHDTVSKRQFRHVHSSVRLLSTMLRGWFGHNCG